MNAVQTENALDATAEGASESSGPAILLGLVGRGIRLSRTPHMHEVEAACHGRRCVYRLLDTDTMGDPAPCLGEVIRSAEIAGYAGLNVTHPYKEEALQHLDTLSDTARAIGAVNTIVFAGGARRGHNTDCWGFAESFRREMDGAPRRAVMLLGAGGAGSAVAHALLDCGVERLLIRDTNPEAAERLVGRLAERVGADRVEVIEDLASAVDTVDGVVNASPVGMARLPGSPLPLELLGSRLWIADIVYFPLETELLREARLRGCRTLSGSGMAIFQAARAFELFTGLRPDNERMKAAFDAYAE